MPLASAEAQSLGLLRDELAGRIARAPATAVGLYYHNLTRPDSILIGANLRLHAASTMKVPVMIQIFRDADAGLLRLDDSLPVHATFPSLLDGSPFDVDRADDSDSTLYLRLGGRTWVRELLELMITRSSNLATDLLIERVGAERAQGTARSLGAWSIQVLRGVEDGKAYRVPAPGRKLRAGRPHGRDSAGQRRPQSGRGSVADGVRGKGPITRTLAG